MPDTTTGGDGAARPEETELTARLSAEILGYLRNCASKYGILPHIRFHAEVTGAEFDEARGTWRVQMKDGQHVRARSLD